MSLSGKKAYFPVESLVGLGHFNRTGKIVQEMVKAGVDMTVASGTFVDRERFFPGATHAEMPPHVFSGGDRHYTLDADGKRTIIPAFNAAAHTVKRAYMHAKNIADVRPDVMFSEFWPFDRPQFDIEMEQMIAATDEEALGKKCARIVSVRDVLNSKDAIKNIDTNSDGEEEAIARDDWAAGVIHKHFDAVLVHGDPRFVDLSETFKSIQKIDKPIIYTGYVLNDLPQRAAVDAVTGPIVVSCGSGASGHDMILSFMAAWGKLIDRAKHDPQARFVTSRPLHIVCGPRFMDEYYKEVAEWGDILAYKSGSPVEVHKYRTDLTTMMANAAFSVSLAGYNTTLETLALEVPALFVPHYVFHHGEIKPNPEQVYRLSRLEQFGMASYVMPQLAENSDLFAEKIMREFLQQISEPRKPELKLDFSGAEKTLQAVERILQKAPAVKR